MSFTLTPSTLALPHSHSHCLSLSPSHSLSLSLSLCSVAASNCATWRTLLCFALLCFSSLPSTFACLSRTFDVSHTHTLTRPCVEFFVGEHKERENERHRERERERELFTTVAARLARYLVPSDRACFFGLLSGSFSRARNIYPLILLLPWM